MGMLHSGRNIGLFIGKESSFGVAAPATACLKQTGFSGGIKPEYIESASRLGSRATAGAYQSSKMGSLSVPAEMDPENLGFFLKGLLGNESITDHGGGAYTHTFTMINESGLPSWSLTRHYNWTVLKAVGAILNSLSIEIAPKALVTGTAEYMFKSEQDTKQTFLPAAVDIDDDEIDCDTTNLADDDIIKFYKPVGSAVLPAPLQPNKTYYITIASAGKINLSETLGGAAINLTSVGVGQNHFAKFESIEPTAARPFIYNDAFIYVDGVAFGECKNASLSFGNNLSQDDFRLNYNGELASMPANKFDATGKVAVVFNEDGLLLRDKYLNGVETAFKIVLDTGIVISGIHKISLEVEYGRAQLRSGDPSTDEAGMMMDMDFTAFSDPVSPVIVRLKNTRAGAY